MWRGWRLPENRYVMSAMVPRGRMRESGGAPLRSASQSVSVSLTDARKTFDAQFRLRGPSEIVDGRSFDGDTIWRENSVSYAADWLTRGATVSDKRCRGGAFSYVASALAARGAVTTTRLCVLADILDSPAMESIRKWFYRPKVSAFRSVALTSRFPSLFPRLAFAVPSRPLLPSFLSAFLVVWLSWSNACARSFFSRPSPPSCWACALLPPVSWKFARYPERCASGDALHLRDIRARTSLIRARACRSSLFTRRRFPPFFRGLSRPHAYKEIETSLIEAASSAGRARPNQLIRDRARRFLIFWAARAAAGALDAMFFSTLPRRRGKNIARDTGCLSSRKVNITTPACSFPMMVKSIKISMGAGKVLCFLELERHPRSGLFSTRVFPFKISRYEFPNSLPIYQRTFSFITDDLHLKLHDPGIRWRLTSVSSS